METLVRKTLELEQYQCRKCGRFFYINRTDKVSIADVGDAVVFVGDEIVKTHAGDITNRNCVRCNYPEEYPDYEHYDEK